MNLIEAITDPAVWRGEDLQNNRSWEYHLNAEQQGDILAALADVVASGLSLTEIRVTNFPLPSLGPVIESISADVQAGRGFALLRNFPVADLPLGHLELAYWGLCSHFGTGVTQNSDATFIHYVTDGVLRPNQGSRGVGVPTESQLHVDLSDCASLLCVRQAADEPPSWLASSLHIYNELLRQAPEVLPRLRLGYQWDRMGEHGSQESATSGYRVPVFSDVDGVLSCRYNRNWITAAARRQNTRLDDEDFAAFDLLDDIARQSRLTLPFVAGDIQFVNNYTVLHGRAGHESDPDENRKRLLMRIWFDFAQGRPLVDDAVVRYGIVRHGNLGWTAAQARAGLVGSDRARRGDGAVVLAERPTD